MMESMGPKTLAETFKEYTARMEFDPYNRFST